MVLEGHKKIGEISKEYGIARSTVDIWCKNKYIENKKTTKKIVSCDCEADFNYEVPNPNIKIELSVQDETLLKEVTPKSLTELIDNSKDIHSDDEVDILIKAIHIITKRMQK